MKNFFKMLSKFPWVWIIPLVLLLVISTFLYLYITNKQKIKITTSSGVEHALTIEVANTIEKRRRGLSGRESLGENSAMYFIHEDENMSSYWMIDMKIPLDIIFLDKSKKIIYIEKNAQPCKSQDICPFITPPTAFQYVLEVNGGYTDRKGIVVGDTLRTNFFTFAP